MATAAGVGTVRSCTAATAPSHRPRRRSQGWHGRFPGAARRDDEPAVARTCTETLSPEAIAIKAVGRAGPRRRSRFRSSSARAIARWRESSLARPAPGATCASRSADLDIKGRWRAASADALTETLSGDDIHDRRAWRASYQADLPATRNASGIMMQGRAGAQRGRSAQTWLGMAVRRLSRRAEPVRTRHGRASVTDARAKARSACWSTAKRPRRDRRSISIARTVRPPLSVGAGARCIGPDPPRQRSAFRGAGHAPRWTGSATRGGEAGGPTRSCHHRRPHDAGAKKRRNLPTPRANGSSALPAPGLGRSRQPRPAAISIMLARVFTPLSPLHGRWSSFIESPISAARCR